MCTCYIMIFLILGDSSSLSTSQHINALDNQHGGSSPVMHYLLNYYYIVLFTYMYTCPRQLPILMSDNNYWTFCSNIKNIATELLFIWKLNNYILANVTFWAFPLNLYDQFYLHFKLFCLIYMWQQPHILKVITHACYDALENRYDWYTFQARVKLGQKVTISVSAIQCHLLHSYRWQYTHGYILFFHLSNRFQSQTLTCTRDVPKVPGICP